MRRGTLTIHQETSRHFRFKRLRAENSRMSSTRWTSQRSHEISWFSFSSKLFMILQFFIYNFLSDKRIYCIIFEVSTLVLRWIFIQKAPLHFGRDRDGRKYYIRLPNFRKYNFRQKILVSTAKNCQHPKKNFSLISFSARPQNEI